MSTKCRLCLSNLNNFNGISITGQNERCLEVQEKLSVCVPEFDLHLVEKSVMCLGCCIALNNAFYFKRRCLESQKHICDYINFVNINKTALENLNGNFCVVSQKKSGAEHSSSLKNENIGDAVIKQETNCLSDLGKFISATNNCELVQNLLYESGSNNRIKQEPPDCYENETNIEFTEENSEYESEEVIPNPSYVVFVNSNVKEEKILPFENKFIVNLNLNKDETKNDVKDRTNALREAKVTATPNQANDSGTETTEYIVEAMKYSKEVEDAQENVAPLNIVASSKSNEDSFTCNVCNDKFTNKSVFVVHFKHHEKTQTCMICGYQANYMHLLRKHYQIHSTDEQFKCDLCDYQSTYKPMLQNHRQTHIRETLFECDTCKVQFKHEAELNKHVVSHMDTKPYVCKICNRKFKLKQSLQIHMRNHSGERPFTCKVCNAAFTQRGILTQHLRLHTKERPYVCEICNWRFTQKGSLVEHVRIHMKDKPFKCSVCDLSFARRIRLTEHMRQHTGERPFVCEVCQRRYPRKQELQKHMSLHKRSRAFECELCKKTFGYNKGLLNHIQYHHKEESEIKVSNNRKSLKCNLCGLCYNEKISLDEHLIKEHTK